MWPDNETQTDLFGFKVHADLIRNVITNDSMLPTTIGVFGDWGGGKTSIMKMLQKDLDPKSWPEDSAERAAREKIAVVYVNTWLFEGYDDAKAALLAAVLEELSEHTHFGHKIKEKVGSLLKSVNWMRFAGLTMKHVAVPAAVALLTGGAAALPAALAASTGIAKALKGPKNSGSGDGDSGDEPGEEKTDNPDLEGLLKEDTDEGADLRTFRKRFKKLLDHAKISTLVVLVDDLDRCTPERIIENLEAVKLFLSAEQTAFVIGADRRIVEHAIRDKYSQRAGEDDKEQRDKLVRDYLEKLVQIPYSLPRLSSSEIQTYMTLLFCQRNLNKDDFDKCVSACNTQRQKDRYSSFGYAGVKAALALRELTGALDGALALTVSAAPLISDGLKGNPRQVKRFLNALLLRKELASVAGLSNIRDAILVKLMILEYTNERAFSELFGWQSQSNGVSPQLAVLEAVLAGRADSTQTDEASKLEGRWTTPALKKWLEMEPKLAGVDLRDYFWVARDRLESTFTGIAMIPPVVRVVLEGLFHTSPPKRNAARDAAPKLTSDERSILLQAIDQHIKRQPDDQTGYEALNQLIEAKLSDAAELLATILMQRPLEKVPATVGMQVMTLINSHPQFAPILEPVRDHLWNSSTQIGKAALAAKRKK